MVQFSTKIHEYHLSSLQRNPIEEIFAFLCRRRKNKGLCMQESGAVLILAGLFLLFFLHSLLTKSNFVAQLQHCVLTLIKWNIPDLLQNLTGIDSYFQMSIKSVKNIELGKQNKFKLQLTILNFFINFQDHNYSVLKFDFFVRSFYSYKV